MYMWQNVSLSVNIKGKHGRKGLFYGMHLTSRRSRFALVFTCKPVVNTGRVLTLGCCPPRPIVENRTHRLTLG